MCGMTRGARTTACSQCTHPGTFTISNGGVFGSLMGTPILNPPQTGILGMHKIQQRPVAVAGTSVRTSPILCR